MVFLTVSLSVAVVTASNQCAEIHKCDSCHRRWLVSHARDDNPFLPLSLFTKRCVALRDREKPRTGLAQKHNLHLSHALFFNQTNCKEKTVWFCAYLHHDLRIRAFPSHLAAQQQRHPSRLLVRAIPEALEGLASRSRLISKPARPYTTPGRKIK